MNNYEQITQNLVNFIKTQVEKIGAKGAVLGLSGGIDSAVVAVLAKRALGENLLCAMLPSSTSNPKHFDDALNLCQKFDIKNTLVSIAPLQSAYTQPQTPLQRGNFSARLRMCVLYDISASHNYIVLGTSNKSEICLGYGTIFGDTACAINPIGSLYKSEIFELASHLEVPQSIIDKAPSADLWEGQSDEEEIGYTYKMIDEFFTKYLDENTPSELLIEQFGQKMYEDLSSRYTKNRFKTQMPTIAPKDSK